VLALGADSLRRPTIIKGLTSVCWQGEFLHLLMALGAGTTAGTSYFAGLRLRQYENRVQHSYENHVLAGRVPAELVLCSERGPLTCKLQAGLGHGHSVAFRNGATNERRQA